MRDDEKTVYWVRDREVDGRWHRATQTGVRYVNGCVVCERSCDGETLWVVPGTTDVRTERYPVHEASSCASCDAIHLRTSRARMVTSIAEAFDVPEHVIDAPKDSTPAGWTWGKVTSHTLWHLWTEATDDADTVRMACDRIDSDASVDRDSLARRSDEYREGRANCSTCRALWPWVRTFDDATREREESEATRRLRVGLDQAMRSLGTVVREREALRRERNDAVTASLERIKERDDAVRENAVRVRERDNALRTLESMRGARDRDLVAYDRLRRERNEAVVRADAADAETTRLRRMLHDLRGDESVTSWANVKPLSFTVQLDNDAAFEAVSGFKVVRTHTRYGRITEATGQPLPFTPVCALCPDQGRHLMSRATRANALYALTLHVVRSHARSVPLTSVPGTDAWQAACSVDGCDVGYDGVDEDTQLLRRRVVSHEVDCHSEES